MSPLLHTLPLRISLSPSLLATAPSTQLHPLFQGLLSVCIAEAATSPSQARADVGR